VHFRTSEFPDPCNERRWALDGKADVPSGDDKDTFDSSSYCLVLSVGSIDIFAQKAARHRRRGPIVAVTLAEKERVKARQI